MNIPCIGCKTQVPDINGPTHKYLPASPGCWKLYTDLLAKEYNELGFSYATHKLLVDSYTLQHTGEKDSAPRQLIQSIYVHLLSLYLALETSFPPHVINKTMQTFLDKKNEFQFEWLAPPTEPWKTTIVSITKNVSPKNYNKIIQQWAEEVWDAWSPHHSAIKQITKKISS